MWLLSTTRLKRGCVDWGYDIRVTCSCHGWYRAQQLKMRPIVLWVVVISHDSRSSRLEASIRICYQNKVSFFTYH